MGGLYHTVLWIRIRFILPDQDSSKILLREIENHRNWFGKDFWGQCLNVRGFQKGLFMFFELTRKKSEIFKF